MIIRRHIFPRSLTSICAISAFFAVSACENGEFQNPFQSIGGGAASSAAPAPAGGSTEERDVEAPEVFNASEPGLWDGRPSLGGVWVSHPDVTDPERVIIRNTANNKFVIGALFRPGTDRPGPRLQVSSDAAEALGMLAGAPSALNVVALRRETVALPATTPEPETDTVLSAGPEVETSALDPIASAGAAIDRAETAAAPVAAAATVPTPKPQPKPNTSGLSKPFVQIGIFSVESNARNTATSLRQIGIVPTVLEQKSKGKTFWRVIVGPANTSSERAGLLKKIKAQGFSDAYFVTN